MELKYEKKQVVLYVKSFARFADKIHMVTHLTHVARAERWTAYESRNLLAKFTHQLGIKHVFRLRDGHLIETGIYSHCQESEKDKTLQINAGVEIATQVGCKEGCVMCASGSLLFVRNLSADEMWEQITQSVQIEGMKPNEMEKLFFVSAMGTGEPSMNPKNVADVLKKAREHFPKVDLNISTNAINPKAIKFWADELSDPFHLQLSLHAPNNEIRKQIMPAIADVKSATIENMLEQTDYFHGTHPNSKIWVAYTPMKGINDSEDNIQELLKKTLFSRREFLALKFLVLNKTSVSENNGICSSDLDKIQCWVEEAKDLGYLSAYRWHVVADIACGQLVRDQISQNKSPFNNPCG
jgi:23S rRNA (adenine2503-C2)-methyltransferase